MSLRNVGGFRATGPRLPFRRDAKIPRRWKAFADHRASMKLPKRDHYFLDFSGSGRPCVQNHRRVADLVRNDSCLIRQTPFLDSDPPTIPSSVRNRQSVHRCRFRRGSRPRSNEHHRTRWNPTIHRAAWNNWDRTLFSLISFRLWPSRYTLLSEFVHAVSFSPARAWANKSRSPASGALGARRTARITLVPPPR